MIKRLLAGFALAAMLSTASACYLEQLWLVLELEFEFPTGRWVEVTCVDFPSGPFEIAPGTYKWYGQFFRPAGTAGRFPRRFRYIGTAWDADGNRLWRERYTVPLDRRTGMFDTRFTYDEEMVIPLGGRYCGEANFSAPGLPAGSMLDPLNVELLE